MSFGLLMPGYWLRSVWKSRSSLKPETLRSRRHDDDYLRA